MKSAKHIGIYHAADGEISLSKFIQKKNNVCFYSPKINSKTKSISFHYQQQFSRGLQKHHWGILEPCNKRQKKAAQLDVILMPLVAFTPVGERMGMGGGFYDRTFSYRNQANIRNYNKKTILIGVAHNLQQVTSLATQPWDVNCDFIVTDKHCFHSKQLRCACKNNKIKRQANSPSKG